MKYLSREYLILAASMLAFTAVLFWLTRWQVMPWVGAGGLILLLIPRTGLMLVRVWKAGSHGLSQLVNGLLLAVLFFLILSPLALLRRLIRRDSSSQKSTYYQDKKKKYEIGDLEKMW